MDLRRRAALGAAASAMVIGGLFCFGDGGISNEFFLYEALPYFRAAQTPDAAEYAASGAAAPVFAESGNSGDGGGPFAADPPGAALDVLSSGQMIFQDDHGNKRAAEPAFPAAYNAEDLRDAETLKQRLYSVEPSTELLPGDVDIDEAVSADFTLSPGAGPKILIFHTHMYECFADSDPDDINQGVYGAGERLAGRLREYGIEVMHSAERFDIVNGKVNIDGGYERMEPAINKILEENPSIEAAIDLHRDGVTGTKKTVCEINGAPSARVMFFNGMSRVKNGGVIKDIAYLPNPNLKDNLRLSLRAKLTADALYPGLAKNIYLKPHRFSLHLLPKSMLIEVGDQNNTMAEAARAMDALADTLARVFGG